MCHFISNVDLFAFNVCAVSGKKNPSNIIIVLIKFFDKIITSDKRQSENDP
jgi:hypothetical protein